MSNQQTQQAQPQVAIPLPKGKKNAVQIGCICMMLSLSSIGDISVENTRPYIETESIIQIQPI